jgi:hypothetical protein
LFLLTTTKCSTTDDQLLARAQRMLSAQNVFCACAAISKIY